MLFFVCGEPKDSQEGRKEGCQAVDVRAGCLHGLETLPVDLVIDRGSLLYRVDNLQGQTVRIHQDQNINKGQK